MVCVCVVNVQVWLHSMCFRFSVTEFLSTWTMYCCILWAANFYVALAQMTACYAIISGTTLHCSHLVALSVERARALLVININVCTDVVWVVVSTCRMSLKLNVSSGSYNVRESELFKGVWSPGKLVRCRVHFLDDSEGNFEIDVRYVVFKS